MPNIREVLQQEVEGLTDAFGNPIICYPAASNVYDVKRRGQPRKHLGMTFHSTEGHNSWEWFASGQAGGSTPWLVSSGDNSRIYHCVPEAWVAYAQGTYTKKSDKRFNDKLVRDGGRPSWMPRTRWGGLASYNTFFDGIEIEGFASRLEEYLIEGNPQWMNLVKLCSILINKHNYKKNRHYRHMDLCFKKSDPGEWFGRVAMPRILQQSYALAEGSLVARDTKQVDTITEISDPPAPVAPLDMSKIKANAEEIENHEQRLVALESFVEQHRKV